MRNSNILGENFPVLIVRNASVESGI